MIFGASTFLYLLPLAGLPILFHFMLKLKKRQVVFSTLMFLRRTDPRLNSRRKIQQWLLLLMRILLILFILLALSRPVLQIAGGFGSTPVVIVLVDNSGSMSAPADNDRTKLEYAVEGARKLVAALKSGCQSAVFVLVDDPEVKQSEFLTSDKELLSGVLDSVRGTEAAGDPEKALSRAFDFIGNGISKTGVVHVFSDLQTGEWGQKTAVNPPRGLAVSVHLHRIESRAGDFVNAAISAVEFPEETILPGHPYTFGVVIKNTCDSVVTVRLNSIDSQEANNTENVTLQPKAYQTRRLTFVPKEAGFGWMKMWLEGDDFTADNAACIGIYCKESENVLFAGDASEFGVLPLAISPSGDGQLTGLVRVFCRVSNTPGELAAKEPILAVMTWDGLSKLYAGGQDADVKKYVENGGNLLIVPSTGSRRPSVGLPDWLGASIRARGVYSGGLRLNVLETQSPFWAPLRGPSGQFQAGDMRVFACFSLQTAQGYEPLLGLSRDRPVIARKLLGKGRIYVSGTAFDPNWNTLPQGPFGVVLSQRIALDGTFGGKGESELVVAGGRVENMPAFIGDVEIMSLIGDPIDWKGNISQVPGFARTGAYVMKSGDDRYCVSVRAAEKEGADETVEDNKVPILGSITHKVVKYDASQDFAGYSHESAKTTAAYVPLLLLATLALLAEGLLANPAPRKYASQAAIPMLSGRKQSVALESGAAGGDSEEIIREVG